VGRHSSTLMASHAPSDFAGVPYLLKDMIAEVEGVPLNAIGTVFGATAAWIVGRAIRQLGREPGPDEIL
jgi:hypothetical protein